MEVTPHTISYLKKCNHVFFGGTNSLCGEMEKYTQWGVNMDNYESVTDVILMGLGWWQYQDTVSDYTRTILHETLSKTYLHCVRDSYSLEKLKGIGITNVINTGCPTLWDIDTDYKKKIKRKKARNVVCAFTDYRKNLARDSGIFDVVKGNYKKIYFWLQGVNDYDYISSNFKPDFPGQIEFLRPDPAELNRIFERKDVEYVGTRLHAGIRALQCNRRAIIIGVDNRANEMKKDFNLPVLEAEKMDSLEEVINSPLDLDLKIPHDEVRRWKEQFK